MNELRLTSPLPPSVNNYLNYRVERRGSKFFVKAYPSPETVKYKKEFLKYVQREIINQNWVTPEKEKIIHVECYFYLNRKRKDPNNFLKVPFDVFSEAKVYEDDDKAIPVGKRLLIDKNNPRIEFIIKVGQEVGVFKDALEYQNFISTNCAACSRSREKCSVLKSLLDNKIHEKVIDFKNCNFKKIKK